MHRTPRRALLILAAAVAALGCEAGDVPETAETGAAPGSPGAAEPAVPAADFAPVNQSGVTGTVAADHEEEGTTVTVQLTGLEPGTTYPVHIHSGRCAAGGPVTVPLGRIRARSDGTGRVTTRVGSAQLGPDEPAFVQVHGSGGAAIACADLAGHERGPQPLTDRATADSAEGAGGGGR